MRKKLKMRAFMAAGLLLFVAWATWSCGGDAATVTPSETTAAGDATATPNPADALPTFSPERVNEGLLNDAQNIATSIEIAGGIRKACETGTPCNRPDNPLQNWEAAANRCALVQQYSAAKTAGPASYSALFDGLTTSCAKVLDTMGKLKGTTTSVEHKTFAEDSLTGLQALITAAASSGR